MNKLPSRPSDGRRFSDYFKLGKSQAELDFVDIPIATDLPLFCDPYSFVIENDPWFIRANNVIVDFFEHLITFIRTDKEEQALKVLGHVGEVNEVHLGFSVGRPRGSGIGADKAADLYRKLRESQAAKSGRLRDLSDCDLFVHGIGPDNISDLTINIVRGLLLDYTASQCANYGVQTKRIQGGFQWNPDDRRWQNGYAELPVVDDKPVILIPKAAVRYQLSLDHQKYYKDFVLDFLRAEHLAAEDGLVQVLKGGRRRVTQKDLKARYPVSKNYLFEFSEQHPEVLAEFKKKASKLSRPLSNVELEGKQGEPKEVDYEAIADALVRIPPGRRSASDFHAQVFGALEAIFYPELRNFLKEREINQGRKRVDIVANNSQRDGFFGDLACVHRVLCPYIMIECKNYAEDPSNPELDQLLGRLGNKRSQCGLLVCRTVENWERMKNAAIDAYKDHGSVILVLTDEDLVEMLKARARADSVAISNRMHEKLRDIQLT
jgi:hypothetical protein